ncbi:Ff.00g106600.m01.CDS01 [Fusarium sp. VM40]|nr:Ff.00g106600.m01.CDS01 [Fusarium sp. VM40]
MDLFIRGNDALKANPPYSVDHALPSSASDWLWAVTAIFVLTFLVLVGLCFVAHESKRVFHYLFAIVLLVGSTCYYAEAANLGWVPIPMQRNNDTTYQLFYAKYIYWTVSFPSLALALGLLANVSWTTIMCNIGSAWVWVLTYLAAALTPTDYKWGFFAFGTLAYVILAMSTTNESHEAAEKMGIGKHYRLLSLWTNVLWLLYPIAFGLSDGSHRIAVTAGSIFFGVLDVLMVPVLTFTFVFLSRSWDWKRLRLAFSEVRH